jgi:hypothetical protein
VTLGSGTADKLPSVVTGQLAGFHETAIVVHAAVGCLVVVFSSFPVRESGLTGPEPAPDRWNDTRATRVVVVVSAMHMDISMLMRLGRVVMVSTVVVVTIPMAVMAVTCVVVSTVGSRGLNGIRRLSISSSIVSTA